MLAEVPIVLSDNQFEFEADTYFLDCIKNHPNLYVENHKFYNDEIMDKLSWALVAKDNAITALGAKKKWAEMMEQYAESNSQSVSHSSNEPSEDRLPAFIHYDYIKNLMDVNKNQTENLQKRPVNQKKNHLASSMKQANTLTSRVRQATRTLVDRKSSDCPVTEANSLVGKVIFNELQKLSPQEGEVIRSRLLQRILLVPQSTAPDANNEQHI